MNKEIRLFEKNQTRLVCRGYGFDFLFSCIIHLVSDKNYNQFHIKTKHATTKIQKSNINSVHILSFSHHSYSILQLLYVKSIEYNNVL